MFVGSCVLACRSCYRCRPYVCVVKDVQGVRNVLNRNTGFQLCFLKVSVHCYGKNSATVGGKKSLIVQKSHNHFETLH